MSLITSFKSDKEHCLTDVCIIYVCIFVCLFVVNSSVSIACLSSSVSFGFLDPLTHILQYGRLQWVRGGGGGGGDHGCGREGAQTVRNCLPHVNVICSVIMSSCVQKSCASLFWYLKL